MFSFQESIKSSSHGESAILYNLDDNHFFKMPRKGLDFLEKFLEGKRNEKELLGTLNEDEYKNFVLLLNYMKERKYIREVLLQPDSDKVLKKTKQEFLEIRRSAYYEVTDKCNLNCFFCYANPHHISGQIEGDFKLSRKIIDKASKLNIFSLVISGGEPLLRKDIFKLIKYAKKKMDRVAIATNGVLIDQVTAEKLKESGIDKVSVSLESRRKEVHESLRGKDTFEKTLYALYYLKQAGFDKESLDITTTVTQKNIHVLHELPGFAEELGAKLNFSAFQPVGRGKLHDELMLTGEQYIKFLLDVNSYKLKPLANLTEESEDQAADCGSCKRLIPHLKTMCGLVEKSLAIKSNGDLVPCHLFFSVDDPGMIIGNIRDISIEDKLWKFYLEKIPTVDEKEGCKECNLRYFCGCDCFAPGYYKYGSLYTAHPFCDRFKVYYSALVDSLGSQNEVETFRENLKSRFKKEVRQ